MKIVFILLGLLSGIALTLSSAGIFIFILFLLCLYAIKTFTKIESKEFLIKLFILSFIIRVILSFANYQLGLIGPYKGADTQPDAIIYNGNAFYIANVLKGTDFSEGIIVKEPFLANSIEVAYAKYRGKLPAGMPYQYDFYVYLLGVAYAWLGYSPIAVKVMNGLLGSLGIIAVYYIARKLFETESTARLSAVMFAFFPSIVYWSVTTLRDTLINFLFLIYLLYIVNFIKERKKTALLVSFLSALFMSILRPKIYFIIMGGILLVIVLSMLKNILFNKSLAKSVALVIFISIGIVFISMNRYEILTLLQDNLNKIVNYHVVTVNSYSNATTYRIFPDFVYQSRKLSIKYIFSISFIFSVVKSWAYYFLSPFPWGSWTKNFLPFYPQIILVYLLVPFVIMGAVSLFRKDAIAAIIVFSLMFFLITPQALAEGVMGTAFRHRDIFTPFGLILAAHAINIRKGRKPIL